MIIASILLVVVAQFLAIMEINGAVSSFPNEGKEELLAAVGPATERFGSAFTFTLIGFGLGVPMFVGGLVLFLPVRRKS